MLKRIIAGIALLLGVATIAAASADAQVPRIVDAGDAVVLPGNVRRQARTAADQGPAALSVPMERMILSLRISPDKQARLDALLADLHDPHSADFHRWLTPEEFGQRFGPAPEDIQAITDWLTSEGFVVEEVAGGRTWINFSGDVSRVQHAFRTQIRNYLVDGAIRQANARDPSIPRALADVVAGVVSMHNFPRKAMNAGARRGAANQGSSPTTPSGSGNHYLSPGDFATIYNVNPLYAAGIDGTGQTIAIVGRVHPPSTNWTTFRSLMALPPNPPQVVINGTDPGDWSQDEDVEADLDVEWSGAVAKNATIKFVISKSTFATDGVDLSAQYIVNNNLAAVMSTSFGSCEADMTTSENNFYANIWAQAAAQGITSFVASGDSGASGCDGGGASSGTGLGVNGLASTPSNVAVGGTQFDDASGSYWNPTNGTGNTSAKSYIPEVAWNESGAVAGGSGLWSTGGGSSLRYGKPSWQVAPGVPADGKRDIPDISLSAAGHVGYLVQTLGALYSVGGTSASSPAAAGLMALIVQQTGQRQGNANVRFYQLGNAQYGMGGATVFHDTIAGNNSVPGVTGYATTTGYDRSTGLGSVDANALVTHWVSSSAPGAPTIGTAAAGDKTATVAFGAAVDHGSPIMTYTATSFPGGILGSCTAPCASINVAGLANGTAYTFTVTATNAFGSGPPSPASNSVTPSGPPIVTTSAATGIMGTAATLTGTVSSNGASAAVTFQYGLTTGYGSSVTATQSPLAANAAGATGVRGDRRARLQYAVPFPRGGGQQRRHHQRRRHDVHDGGLCADRDDQCSDRDHGDRRRPEWHGQQQRCEYHGHLPVRPDRGLRHQRCRGAESACSQCGRCAGVGGDHRARLQHALPLPRGRGEQRRHHQRRRHDVHDGGLRADRDDQCGDRDRGDRRHPEWHGHQQRREHHGHFPIRPDDGLWQQRDRNAEPAFGQCVRCAGVSGRHRTRLQHALPLPRGRGQ